MQSLDKIVNANLRHSAFWRGAQSALLVEKANEFLTAQWGSTAQKNARALYIKNGTLVIACLNSVLAQEIKLREAALLSQLNGGSGQISVKKVRYLA